MTQYEPHETDQEFHHRACRQLRGLADKCERAVDLAFAELEADRANADPNRPASRRDPAVAFARAATALRSTIALESRLRAAFAKAEPKPEPEPQPGAPTDPKPKLQLSDRRKILIRTPLQNHIKSEPDRKLRNAIAHEIDACIDRHLAAADPDLAVRFIYEKVCIELGIIPDPKTLSDELLGILPAHLMPRSNQSDDSLPDW